MTLEQFKGFAAEHPEAVASYIEQGKKAATAQATADERARVAGILGAHGLAAHAALASITSGHDVETAKLIADAATNARAEAEASAAAKDKEIEKLKAQIGTTGPVGGKREEDGDKSMPANLTPVAQAEWEWDNVPALKGTASKKEYYVAARAAELDGTHRTFTRKPDEQK